VAPGDQLTVYVSVTTPSTPVEMRVYRLGWYQGNGGRLMYTAHQTGINQGHYDAASHTLVDCAQCTLDPTTHLIEARWRPTFTFTIPADWYTGVYYGVLSDSQNSWTYVDFVVRGEPESTYLAVLPVTTMEAYNDWGGYSLYHGPDGTLATRANKVSFDRPFSGLPFAQGLAYEIDAIRWMERLGYDVSYISSVDLNQRPAQALQHKAFLSLGHDEYWSSAMRDAVVSARDAGVGLIFLGANALYWQIRFEPDSLQQADRTIVCYKDASLDPLNATDHALATDQWRNLGHPENAIIGVMYSNHSNGIGFPWHVDASAASSSLLQGTGLKAGGVYGCDIVGYEWDHVFNNGATPPGLHILATSATVGPSNTRDYSNTVYYVAPSGALVFSSGSIYWEYGLDDFRWQSTTNCPDGGAHVPGIQRLMANVMRAVVTHHSVGAS
jgi:hypothetical protein